MFWEIFGQVFMVLGGIIFVVAGVGLVRLQDPYTRASSVATSGGIGMVCILLGAAIVHPDTGAITKVVIAILLQLATSAVGAMALARAAVMSGHTFTEGTETGELTEHPGVHKKADAAMEKFDSLSTEEAYPKKRRYKHPKRYD